VGFEFSDVASTRRLGHPALDHGVSRASNKAAEINARLRLGENDANGPHVGHEHVLLHVPTAEKSTHPAREFLHHDPSKIDPEPAVAVVTKG
jgi:hypothetical protein